MAGRGDDDQSAFKITLEVDNDSALPKLLEGRVSITLVLHITEVCFAMVPSLICYLSLGIDRLLQY